MLDVVITVAPPELYGVYPNAVVTSPEVRVTTPERVLKLVTPEEIAVIADCTNAVVAILVELSVEGVTVGAVDVPEKAAVVALRAKKAPFLGLAAPIGAPSIVPPVIVGLEI